MNSSGKKFGLPEIIIVMLLAIINDACALLSWFALAIPFVGVAFFLLQKFVSVMIWGILGLYFWVKIGLKKNNLISQAAGGIAELFGLPATMITVATLMWSANHPKTLSISSIATNTKKENAGTENIEAQEESGGDMEYAEAA